MKNITTNGSHTMIYYDDNITNLNDAIKKISIIHNPILKYKQSIPIYDLYKDSAYKNLIRYEKENKKLYLSFPSQCFCISNITNNYNNKMIMYHKEPNNNILKEIIITSNLFLNPLNKNTIIIQTNDENDLIISFDVYIHKNIHSKL